MEPLPKIKQKRLASVDDDYEEDFEEEANNAYKNKPSKHSKKNISEINDQ
eukprot:CAMPEP_0176395410 /NCGR_PEP_ID=MMETSP0126-20121128/43388_1 /TAXON_ID=141414 ORGANISM="Strombidinopsis acuminatum, Strain SPMC142" /NCGR_SAMPLE_ID=MMETSP0126 /ASSEMBLY_ACC=CAM_ASM_000229 /LENGTH=49 /DNA_ID=CAMNT_0017768275 /DNA_START=652 /DNA_END=801 /DNA_ORIENTATION=+